MQTPRSSNPGDLSFPFMMCARSRAYESQEIKESLYNHSVRPRTVDYYEISQNDVNILRNCFSIGNSLPKGKRSVTRKQTFARIRRTLR